MANVVSRRAAGEERAAFKVCRRAADFYLNSGRPFNISASDLYNSIVAASGYSGEGIRNYNPERYILGPVIVDVRTFDSEMPDPYYSGHIPGAIHIPWHEIALDRSLARLPKNRRIVVYSGTGQTGGQAAAVLGVLGYDSVNLKWGITSWTREADAAPGRYTTVRDTIWHEGSAHRTVKGEQSAFCAGVPAPTYPFPSIKEHSNNRNSVIADAARLYLEGCRTPNISAPELYRQLHIGEAFSSECAENQTERQTAELPFLLDVRETVPYNNGFISGSLHIVWADLFKKKNLCKLPPGRQIVVHSGTGHRGSQVTALLGLLGYQATNLRFGMSAWSLSLPGAEIAPGQYSENRDCMNYATVTGFDPFVKCST